MNKDPELAKHINALGGPKVIDKALQNLGNAHGVPINEASLPETLNSQLTPENVEKDP